MLTVDKDRVLLIVSYHYLVYSQAAPEFIQRLRLRKLSYNYVMQLVHNVISLAHSYSTLFVGNLLLYLSWHCMRGIVVTCTLGKRTCMHELFTCGL